MEHLLLFSHTLTIQKGISDAGVSELLDDDLYDRKLKQNNKHDSSTHYFIVGFCS